MPGSPSERHRERQQELDVASAAPVAAHRDRGLATRQQHARRCGGLPVAQHLARDAGVHHRHLARLALQAVAQNHGRDARLPSDVGGGLERLLGRGDEMGLDPGQARIAGLGRFVPRGTQVLDDDRSVR